jgi:hypothetical protein
MARSEGLTPRNGGAKVPLSSIAKILSNRVYSGDFDWKGKTYRGTYEPLVSRELWQRAQDANAVRSSKRHRKGKHDFPFSGLISCGHCGCSLVGDIKKGKYIYYRCTGHRGKCPDRPLGLGPRPRLVASEFGERHSQTPDGKAPGVRPSRPHHETVLLLGENRYPPKATALGARTHPSSPRSDDEALTDIIGK